MVAYHVPPTAGLTWPATQACALTGNQTGDPLVHRQVLSPLSHTSQGSYVIFEEEIGPEEPMPASPVSSWPHAKHEAETAPTWMVWLVSNTSVTGWVSPCDSRVQH